MRDETLGGGLDARRLEAAALAALIAAAFGAYLIALGGPKFRLDDAYIVLNNAQALFAPDTAFPETPALYGSTSFVHTMAAALFGAVFGNELGLLVLAWIGVGLFAFGILELARQAGLSPALRALVALAALTTGDLVQVHLNGLETSLAMATVTWLIVLHRARSPALPVLAAVAPFIRPELLLLSGLVVADAVTRALLRREIAGARRLVLLGAGVFGALLAAQFAVSGTVFPSTGDAKRYFFVTSDLGLRAETAIGLKQVWLFLLQMLPVSLFLLVTLRLRNAPYLLFAAALLGYFVLVQPLIMHQTFYRYLYVLIPLFFLGMVEALGSGQRVLRPVALALLVASLALNVSRAAAEIPGHIAIVQNKYDVLSRKAAWVARNVAPGDVVMVHDVGYLAYASDHRFSDMVGLKSPAAVEVNARLSFRGGDAGRARALSEIAAASESRVLLVSENWNRTGGLSEALAAEGWGLAPHPAGNPPEYEAYLLTPPIR